MKDIYSLTELNCEGEGCWNFFSIKYSENLNYSHPNDVVVEFDKTWIDYNVYDENDETSLGMLIHNKFTLRNMLGKRIYVRIRVLNSEDEFLESYSYLYSNEEDQLEVKKHSMPIYQDALYDDYDIFLPYSQINLESGHYFLKLDVDLIYATGEILSHLKMHSFTYTK